MKTTLSYPYQRILVLFLLLAVAAAILVSAFALPAGAQAPLSCRTIGKNTVPVNQVVSFVRDGGSSDGQSWSAPGGSPSSGVGQRLDTKYATTGTFTVTLTSDGESATCGVTVTSKEIKIDALKTRLLDALDGFKTTLTDFRGRVTASKLPAEQKDPLVALLDEYLVQIDQFIAQTQAATTLDELQEVISAVKSARLSFIEEMRAIIDGIKAGIAAAKESCSPRKAAPFLKEYAKERKKLKIEGILDAKSVLGCDLTNANTGKPDKIPADMSSYGGMIFFGDDGKDIGSVQLALPNRAGFLIYFAEDKKYGEYEYGRAGDLNLALSGGPANLFIYPPVSVIDVQVTGAPEGTIFLAEGSSTCLTVNGKKCEQGVTTSGNATLQIAPATATIANVAEKVTFQVSYDADGVTGPAPFADVAASSVVWRLKQTKAGLTIIDKATGVVTCQRKFSSPDSVQVVATYLARQATAQITKCGN